MSTATRSRWESHLLGDHLAGSEMSELIEEWADRHGYDPDLLGADEIAELYQRWCDDEDEAAAIDRADEAREAERFGDRYDWD